MASLQKRPLRIPVRWAIVAAVVLLVAVLVDLRPDLSHLDAVLLTGPEQGSYHALGLRLEDAVKTKHGHLAAVPTRGTVDNLERLASAREGCSAHFALAQDGVAPPEDGGLELVARLPGSETLIILGRDAGSIVELRQLAGKRVGVGPEKSGTDQLMRRIFASDELAALAVRLENHEVGEQIEALAGGSLDLGAFVIDADAALIRDAVQERELQLIGLRRLDALAERYPFLQVGALPAGHFDLVAPSPPEDRPVLRVRKLVVGNGCASHAETVAFLSLLREQYPSLVEENRQAASDLYPRAASATAFFQNDGPELVEEHVPWLVDLLPPSNWVYIVCALSVAFNLMSVGHRFRLWRIDANRVRIEEDVRDVLGRSLTPAEIHQLEPALELARPAVLEALDRAVAELDKLRKRCRKQALSMLVPMGQEMAYRFQENEIEEELAALGSLRARVAAALNEGRVQVAAMP